MSVREKIERRRRQSGRDRTDRSKPSMGHNGGPPLSPAALLAGHDDDRVLSFRQWCTLNSISLATGRRIINAGNGPVVVQLSPRRIGVRVAENRAWQASRARG
jgi:predicted DNA-binding transcriptional regulator AlpA